MLRRMYLRWCEQQSWHVELLEEQGEPTVRRCVVRVQGKRALDFFKHEQGVHKLTRVSPYGNGKKHTSCVVVTVTDLSPNAQKKADAILDKDLRWDTFRGTGAGGQHRNKRDTAVRLTHIPTDTVVTVLSGRSQYQNKQLAMESLRAKLAGRHEAQLADDKRKRVDRQAQGFGHQVRTYKLDQQMVRDERTGKSHSQPQKVLDGDLSWCSAIA